MKSSAILWPTSNDANIFYSPARIVIQAAAEPQVRSIFLDNLKMTILVSLWKCILWSLIWTASERQFKSGTTKYIFSMNNRKLSSIFQQNSPLIWSSPTVQFSDVLQIVSPVKCKTTCKLQKMNIMLFIYHFFLLFCWGFGVSESLNSPSVFIRNKPNDLPQHTNVRYKI